MPRVGLGFEPDADDEDEDHLTRIRRMARDFPAFLERFIYNDQCVMLD
jgi:hypothetical protein